MLLCAGADPMHMDVNGNTPVTLARQRGHLHTADMIQRWIDAR